MKAVVYTEFGPPDVLKLMDVAQPVPGDRDILIRIHAVQVDYGDLAARNFKNISARDFHMPLILLLLSRLSFGLRAPRKGILGNTFAGEIAAVGRDVRSFRPGDRIFGYTGQAMGGYAEYLRMPEDGTVTAMPKTMTFEEAAAVPYGALTASALLRKVDIRSGHRVLINGASGSIGSHAVQLAKHLGAEVTGVCGTPRMDYVRALGADKVIDYGREDFARNGETYDLIFDVLGKSSWARCKSSLTPRGRYLPVSFKAGHLLSMLKTGIGGGRKVICGLASDRKDDLARIRELVETGAIKEIVDRRFPLDQAADAHAYIEAGRSRGSVILTV